MDKKKKTFIERINSEAIKVGATIATCAVLGIGTGVVTEKVGRNAAFPQGYTTEAVVDKRTSDKVAELEAELDTMVGQKISASEKLILREMMREYVTRAEAKDKSDISMLAFLAGIVGGLGGLLVGAALGAKIEGLIDHAAYEAYCQRKDAEDAERVRANVYYEHPANKGLIASIGKDKDASQDI